MRLVLFGDVKTETVKKYDFGDSTIYYRYQVVLTNIVDSKLRYDLKYMWVLDNPPKLTHVKRVYEDL